MNAPVYTTDILRLAASLAPPRRLGRVDGSAALRSPTCGATIETEVECDDQGRIAAISQKVSACAFGQAAAALAERGAPAKTADEVERARGELADWLDNLRDDPGKWPGLDTLAPARSKRGRHGAILLPFRALAEAMREKR